MKWAPHNVVRTSKKDFGLKSTCPVLLVAVLALFVSGCANAYYANVNRRPEARYNTYYGPYYYPYYPWYSYYGGAYYYGNE